jgi:hypothetical protein
MYLLRWIIFGQVFFILNTNLFSQTTRTVGSGGNYSKLSEAFSAINNGTLIGDIQLQLISNITETSSAIINASGTGSASYTSISIYPTVSNVTISGNLTAPLIIFDGADNVTFDGRVNRTGSTVALTVENTSTLNVNKTSTFFFCNSAENNTITYCTVKGASSSRDGTGSTFNISNVDASSSGTTITVPSSPGTGVLEVGGIITKQSGTGTLAASTYVTAILSNTQFTVNTAPTTALSAATLRVEALGNGNSGGGVINFGFSIAGNGNDNNTISYCNITNSVGNRPFHAINSMGCQRNSVNYSNDGLKIQNCNFYDLFRPATSSQASRNINLLNYTSNVTISGNSFYHTSPFTVNGASTSQGYSCIFAQINIGNGNVNITDNYIGGSAPQCGGASNMVFTAAVSGQQYGVTLINLVGVGSGSSPTNSSTSTVDRNTIKKISVDYTTLASNPFFVAITTGNGSGRCHIRDNIIGSDSENNSIVLSNRSSAGNSTAHGISSGSCPFGGGDSYISGNKIGGIKVDNPSDATKGRSFVAINTSAGCSNAQNLYIRKNTIGSETISNSIDLPNASGASQSFQGMSNGINTCTYIIDSNIIANINNNSSVGSCTGMWCGSGSAHYTINQNTIKNIKANSSFTGININRSASINTNTTIRGNVISNISSDNSTAAVTYDGINLGLGANQVTQNVEISNNFIANFTLSSSNTNTGSIFSGIKYDVGRFSTNYATTKASTTNFFNNIISLGSNISSDCAIYGIYEMNWDAVTTNMYHNTINITGSSPAGSTTKTYCIYKTLQTTNGSNTFNNLNGTRDLRNNQLINSRTISGGASNTVHYSLQLISNSTTVDYNNHYVSSTGSGNFRAVLGSTDYMDITSWRTALTTSRENNSLNLDPVFTNSTGTNSWDYAKSTSTNGITISGYTRDFWNVARGNPPQMGAYENTHQIWTGVTSTDWNTASNWSPANIPSSGINITIPDQTNDPVLDQTRTISQLRLYSGSKLNLNGKSLTVQDSVLLLGQFIGSSTSSLTFNNSGNVGMIYFDQTTPSTTNSLLNLTVNKSSGSLKLGTNLKVNGSLILSNGILDLNGKTLQMVGSDLQTVSGSINASLVNSKISFQNPDPLTIASNSFTGNVYNVELNSSSTINSEQSFTISNNLDLINGNLIISDGASITVEDSILRTSGASLSLGATGSGKIVFKGTYMKLNEVGNLSINPTSSGDILLQEDLTIQGSLELLNGKLVLGSKNLHLNGGLGTIQNGSYIKTESTGKLIRKTNATNTSYLFPIGQSSYTPISVNFQGGIQSNSTLSGRIVSGSHPQMNAEQMEYVRTNYYWEMNSENMTNPNYSVTLNYQDALVTNGLTETELDLRPAKWSAESGWKSSDQCSICHSSGIMGTSTLSTDLNSITWSGVTGFSDFMGLGQGNGSPLPVELLYLEAECLNDEYFSAKWATASENNSSHFILQQSRDGLDWMDKKTLQAAGNSTELINYEEELSVSFPYFRLIQFDLDGDSTVYGPMSNSCFKEEFYFNVFPNPNKGNFQVVMNHSTSFPIEIQLLDITSKNIKTINCDGAMENSILLYTFNEKLTPGNYLVKIQLENGLLINKKIAVQ